MKFMGLCSMVCSCALAQGPTPQELAGKVPLPPAYSGRALETVSRGDSGAVSNTFEFEFAIAPNWTVGTQFQVHADFGRSPIIYEHATLEESYWYSLGRGTHVSRNSRFRDTGMMAIEQSVSPLPIVRVLQSDLMSDIKWSIQDESDVIVLSLRRAKSSTSERVCFDAESHRLVLLQAVSPSGDVVAETRFEDWTPVGDGYEVPVSVVKVLHGPDGDTELRATLSEIRILSTSGPPARKPVPTDATIDDVTSGVTTTADGTVLGKIQPIRSPSVSAQSSSGRRWLDSRTLMILGVCFLLCSGAIIGWRRWKAG